MEAVNEKRRFSPGLRRVKKQAILAERHALFLREAGRPSRERRGRRFGSSPVYATLPAPPADARQFPLWRITNARVAVSRRSRALAYRRSECFAHTKCPPSQMQCSLRGSSLSFGFFPLFWVVVAGLRPTDAKSASHKMSSESDAVFSARLEALFWLSSLVLGLRGLPTVSKAHWAAPINKEANTPSGSDDLLATKCLNDTVGSVCKHSRTSAHACTHARGFFSDI